MNTHSCVFELTSHAVSFSSHPIGVGLCVIPSQRQKDQNTAEMFNKIERLLQDRRQNTSRMLK